MTNHCRNVQELVLTSENLTRDTFLCEQDIQNIVGKLAKETYKKHENDVESVSHVGLRKSKHFVLLSREWV
jgi:hypothetical protein